MDATTLIQQHIKKFWDQIAPFQVAVACSGGPDSMALCYILRSLDIPYRVWIVDHGLRLESKKEALYIQHFFHTQQSIPCDILTWHHDTITKDIQHKARKARYFLLEKACTDHQVTHLLMAHHKDDQLETLVMRRKRSRSLYGLQGMQAVIYKSTYVLCRPLLGITKQQLYDVMQKHNWPFVQDPSNHHRSYERVRVRQYLHQSRIQQHKNLLKNGQEMMLFPTLYYEQLLKKQSLIKRWIQRYRNANRDYILRGCTMIYNQDIPYQDLQSYGSFANQSHQSHRFQEGLFFVGMVWIDQKYVNILYDKDFVRSLLWSLSGDSYPPSPNKTQKFIHTVKNMPLHQSFCIAGVCIRYDHNFFERDHSKNACGWMIYRDVGAVVLQKQWRRINNHTTIWGKRFMVRKTMTECIDDDENVKKHYLQHGAKKTFPQILLHPYIFPNFKKTIIMWHASYRINI